MQECKYTSIQVCQFSSVQIMQVCKYARLQVGMRGRVQVGGIIISELQKKGESWKCDFKMSVFC